MGKNNKKNDFVEEDNLAGIIDNAMHYCDRNIEVDEKKLTIFVDDLVGKVKFKSENELKEYARGLRDGCIINMGLNFD